MEFQVSELSDVAPIFQLVAGVGLVFDVFKVPYVNKLGRIKARLDVAEKLAGRRNNARAMDRLETILSMRNKLRECEREIEELVMHWGLHIRLAIILNVFLLIGAAIWPKVEIHPILTVMLCLGPMGFLSLIYLCISSKANSLLYPLTVELAENIM